MKIAELLKLKTAAKAWLGLLAVAAQVALDSLPDHQSGYYMAVRCLVGVLSLIGIYAVPNRVKTVEQGVDAAKKFASTIVVNAASGVDPQKIASELAWQLGGSSSTATAATPAAPVTPVEAAPVTDTPAPAADPAQAAPAPAATPIQKDTPAP